MSEKFEDYLFEYPYQRSQWSFTIKATSQDDAQARFRALAWAEFKGGPCETIPVSSPRFLFVPLITWWRNLRARSSMDERRPSKPNDAGSTPAERAKRPSADRRGL